MEPKTRVTISVVIPNGSADFLMSELEKWAQSCDEISDYMISTEIVPHPEQINDD